MAHIIKVRKLTTISKEFEIFNSFFVKISAFLSPLKSLFDSQSTQPSNIELIGPDPSPSTIWPK